ncbi:MAG: hypothetical protein H6917_07380 [Novosphingobium sp.]|nr:hypothetical protein [Novosphingobium sp.]MCP5402194.1 hypothetical protein [Novosphingobium sp.]
MTVQVPSKQLAAISEVLSELGAEIENLGSALCRDPDVVARHMHELQAIDLIAQKQRSLASIFAEGFADCAIDAVGLEALRKKISVLPTGNPANH